MLATKNEYINEAVQELDKIKVTAQPYAHEKRYGIINEENRTLKRKYQPENCKSA